MIRNFLLKMKVKMLIRIMLYKVYLENEENKKK